MPTREQLERHINTLDDMRIRHAHNVSDGKGSPSTQMEREAACGAAVAALREKLAATNTVSEIIAKHCPHDGALLNPLSEHPGSYACPRCEHVDTILVVPGPRNIRRKN